MKQVEIKVTHIKGFCSAGYQLSDKIVFKDPLIKAPNGKPICLYAISAFSAYLSSLGRNVDESDWINQIKELHCPDPQNTVVFAINRD